MPSVMATGNVSDPRIATWNIDIKNAPFVRGQTWRNSRVETHRDSGVRLDSLSPQTMIEVPPAYSQI